MKRTLALLLLLSASGEAFETAYFSFQAPTGFTCQLTEGVWVCGGKGSEEAGLFLTVATLREAEETLGSLESRLGVERAVSGPDGKTGRSHAARVARIGTKEAPMLEATLVDFPRVGWRAEVRMGFVFGKEILTVAAFFLLPPKRSAQAMDDADRTLASIRPAAEMKVVEVPGPGRRSTAPDILDFVVRFTEKRKLVGP